MISATLMIVPDIVMRKKYSKDTINNDTLDTSLLLSPPCCLSSSSMPSQASLSHGMRDSSSREKPQGAADSHAVLD